MKRYVLSIVKTVITASASPLPRKQNRGSFSIYAALVFRFLLPGSGPNDSSVSHPHTTAPKQPSQSEPGD